MLREIVLTLCARNSSIEPLLKKLRQPYADEDKFFSGYTTVNEKEATEAYEKAERFRAENDREKVNERLNKIMAIKTPSYSSPWYRGIGGFILLALCVGGYKACNTKKEYEKKAAVEQVYMQTHRHVVPMRNLPPRKISPENVSPDNNPTGESNN